MGEAKAKRSATQRFISLFPQCCFCGGARPATTREHMPPKVLFDGSLRPDKLVMPACDDCNRGTSAADLVSAIVSRWNYNQQSPDHAKLIKAVRHNYPQLIAEWTRLDASGRLNARLHLQKNGVYVPPDAGMASIGPLTIKYLNLFAHKVVLALYFEHFRKHIPESGGVSAFWRSKEDFAKEGIPPILLEMMKRYGTLEQGKWNVSEIFEYRYEINESDGLMATIARLRGNLFVVGFAVADLTTVDEALDDWLRPSQLLTIATDSRFEKRK